MVTETSGTRTGTLDSEYKNIGIIPIYFVLHWLLGLGRWAGPAGEHMMTVKKIFFHKKTRY